MTAVFDSFRKTHKVHCNHCIKRKYINYKFKRKILRCTEHVNCLILEQMIYCFLYSITAALSLYLLIAIIIDEF